MDERNARYVGYVESMLARCRWRFGDAVTTEQLQEVAEVEYLRGSRWLRRAMAEVGVPLGARRIGRGLWSLADLELEPEPPSDQWGVVRERDGDAEVAAVMRAVGARGVAVGQWALRLAGLENVIVPWHACEIDRRGAIPAAEASGEVLGRGSCKVDGVDVLRPPASRRVVRHGARVLVPRMRGSAAHGDGDGVCITQTPSGREVPALNVLPATCDLFTDLRLAGGYAAARATLLAVLARVPMGEVAEWARTRCEVATRRRLAVALTDLVSSACPWELPGTFHPRDVPGAIAALDVEQQRLHTSRSWTRLEPYRTTRGARRYPWSSTIRNDQNPVRPDAR